MASYIVRLLKTDAVLKAEAEKYGCEPYQFRHINVDIDSFIEAVLDCENDGIMIRKTMSVLCPYYSKEVKKNAEVIIGKIFWASSKSRFFKTFRIKETVPTETMLRELGSAFIKCYKIAERYNLIQAAPRNDDRFRYWCTFKMKDDKYNFEHLVFKKWFKETQEKYALEHANVDNIIYMFSKWDEYLDIDLCKLRNINTYIKGSIDRSIMEKLDDAHNYLRIMSRSLRHIYTDIQVVDGRERRITKIVPTECYVPILLKALDKFSKIEKIREELTWLKSMSSTIDDEKVNFHVMYNVSDKLQDMHCYIKYILRDAATINNDTIKVHKNLDNDTYWIPVASTRNPTRTELCHGYYAYGVGPRCSRMPKIKDNRSRIFI